MAKGWRLSYEGVQNFGNIRLSNAAAVDASGTGGGDIQVRSRGVALTDGSQVEASTLGGEPGGLLSVRASELVELIGESADGFPSALGAQVFPEATGNGGNITVETGRLVIQDGALVSADTLGEGAAGNLTVKASESVELIGTDATGRPSTLTALTEGTGATGDLTIATGQLTVRDRAEVSVSSTSTGNAGNLQVTASSAQLDNQGQLTTTSTSGSGGNITLRPVGDLLLRRNSGISTNAGGTGIGGNITINSDTLVALEDSDITADASEGQGGRVQINT